MGKIVYYFILILLFNGCKSATKTKLLQPTVSDFTIAFGSCNKSSLNNLLWDDIVAANPDVWIWGGDIIYADTDNRKKLREMYLEQDRVEGYAFLKTKIPVIGTWDDHDYGLNDGGVEFNGKTWSQQEFLDFMDVPMDSPRRSREGIYATHEYTLPEGHIKIIVLDTRYFRTALTLDRETKKRNKPNDYGQGTVLGTAQWAWLQNELNNSKADFNVIVSSIQFLSNEHGFECWGNFPHEVDRLKGLIASSNAKGVIILSGDRHISEFSRTNVDGLAYPLIDFTSSGLTHVYSSFSGEPNPFRVGEVVNKKSFGLLNFDFNQKLVIFKMVGDNGELLGELEQSY
ncbi:alkaline phosphatase [Sediminicola sp. YIK13]|uniref:alkaline phosphatase D family protein n=1 Tax=Sediminicola sp. YIK13 TaxID=1453352 RepID=UPI00071F0E8F|nr:alkaline phosphatase D family protein [Sediminicola sp. YIK13]ALM09200.1 alkaline phosphatase [Sediminicola sp. YIK13]